MQRGIVETALGACVLVVAIGFAVMLFSSRPVTTGSHYGVDIYFDTAEGLLPQTDVRLGGVKIGYVETIALDQQTLQAVVNVQIDDDVSLPQDSVAEIATAGLLGDAFLKITPGAQHSDAPRLTDGGEIRRTIAPVSLEEMLGKAIFALSQD